MTATATESPLDLSDLTAEDVPTPPDHTKSREERRNFFRGTKDETPRTKPTAKRKKPAPRAKRGAFTEPLTEFYTMLGGVLMPFDPQCGQVIVMSAQQCAESMDNLAYENEAVRRALTAIMQTNAIGAVVFAHLPIIMAIAMHHGPGGMQGAMMGMAAGFSPNQGPVDDD